MSESTAAREVDLLPGLAFDLLADFLDDRRVQLDGAGDGDVDTAVLLLPELVELAPDAEDLRHPVLVDEQLEEVDQLGLGARDRPLDPLLLLRRGEVGAEEEDLQLAVAVDGIGELAQLLLQRVQLAFVAAHLEEGLGVYASCVGHD